MATLLALFRGINVGGNNILRMKDLVSLFQGLGFTDVHTYIQSGNVVFRSPNTTIPEIESLVADAVEAEHGFRPRLLLVSAKDLQQVMDANPFPAAVTEPKTLHCFFLASQPLSPNLTALNDLKSASEEFALGDKVFYLYAPQGIGRSKLAQRAEKILGVPATARNWRSVGKIAEMAQKIDR
jgi:uncharacterized protein (DUF1697 family)